MFSLIKEQRGCVGSCGSGCLAMLCVARPKEAIRLFKECRDLKERVAKPGMRGNDPGIGLWAPMRRDLAGFRAYN